MTNDVLIMSSASDEQITNYTMKRSVYIKELASERQR